MPLSQFIHPELRRHAPALMRLIEQCQDRVPSPDELGELIAADDELSTAYAWVMSVLYDSAITCMGGIVYAVPFLNPSFCAGLVEQADELAKDGGWKRNDCEQSAYQIPEIVVRERSQGLHDLLASFVPYLNIYHAMICQTVPRVVGSIQFTRYDESDCSGGNWHHDLDSDFTAAVSLAPHLFEGGGTDVRTAPTKSARVHPLPAGYALLFNGQKIHHKGAPVTKGARTLLTYWLSSK